MRPFPSPTDAWHDNTYPAISPSRPELSARGKTVVITGGGTGIGAATAHAFAEAGATRIALLGRREQPLLDTKGAIQEKSPGVEVFTRSTDVANKDEVDSAFAAFVGEGNNKIHVLVSNAATTGPIPPVGEADGAEFLEAIQINLRGSLNVAEAFLRCAAADAVIVDVNSNAAHMNVAPALQAYSISKFAVFRLWDCVGFANPGLSVYHLQPGVVDTAMNRAVGGVKALGFQDDRMLSPHPVGLAL